MKNRILISITCIAFLAFILSCGCVETIDGNVSWPAITAMGISSVWLTMFFIANEKSA